MKDKYSFIKLCSCVCITQLQSHHTDDGRDYIGKDTKEVYQDVARNINFISKEVLERLEFSLERWRLRGT